MLSVKVVISSGIGKLHFHETARAAAMAGADVEFVAGWIPSKRHSRLVNFVGRVMGEVSLASRMQARTVDHPRVRMRSNALAEFGGRAMTVAMKRLCARGNPAGMAFEIAGMGSRRWLRNADIFHVRSGAGQGGAIREAKSHGMRILCDHSIAHPAYVDHVLGPEYRQMRLSYRMWATDGLWRRVLRDCAEADRVLVNSDFVKGTFVERGFDPERVDVAYLGVNERFFSLKWDYSIRGPVKILFTGSFTLRKGAATLLEAMRALRRGGLEVRLNLVGRISDGARCIRDADWGFLTHTQFIPPERLQEVMAEADLFVFPTLVEGSSRSAMEAGAAGLPIVTTERCGLPLRAELQEVVHVPPSDHHALADAVSELAGDEGRRSQLGLNAAKRIRGQFTWQQYGVQLMRVYCKLLQAPYGGPTELKEEG